MTLPTPARYSLAAAVFLTPASWLLLGLGCLKYGETWPQTCEPVNYAAAPLAVGAGVSLWFGALYWWRAHRAATRRMWQRVHLGGWQTMELVKRIAWGSEEEPPGLIAGETRFERRRWLVPVPNSRRRVSVDRWRFWQWLVEVDKLQRALPPGESAIAIRRWKGETFKGRKITEGEILAFREILKAIQAVDYTTDDARSMYYVPGQGAVWGRVEEAERVMESEVY